MSGQTKTYSLRQRLLVWLLLPLLLIGLISLIDAYNSARLTADDISDRVLAGSALAIAERIFVNDDGDLDVDIPYVALEMLTSAEEDRVFYKIEGENGDFITGYRNLNLPQSADRSENNLKFSDSEFRNFPIRIAVLEGAASSSQSSLGYRLAIAETTNARNKMAQDILIRSAIRQGLLILTAAIAVWFAVTRALRPLYTVRDAIGRRSSDDLRPILHAVPNEIKGLVTTTNDLLSRIGTSISAMRNFTSNASHQLRTPLAVMRTQAEIARRARSDQDRDSALHQMDEAIQDSEKMISRLMVLARIDSGALENLPDLNCDIAETCRMVCADMISHQNLGKIDLGYEGSDHLLVKGDPVLYREMLRNLVENAVKYGGKDIHITVRCRDIEGMCHLDIEDNGVGMSAQQKVDLMERFSSGEYSKNGSGLGLPIARDIAHLFGGVMALNDRDKGTGLKVSLKFPLLIEA